MLSHVFLEWFSNMFIPDKPICPHAKEIAKNAYSSIADGPAPQFLLSFVWLTYLQIGRTAKQHGTRHSPSAGCCLRTWSKYVEIRWHSSHPAALGKSSCTAAWNRHGPKPWEIGEPGPMTWWFWLCDCHVSPMEDSQVLVVCTLKPIQILENIHTSWVQSVIWHQASSVWEDLITGQGTMNSSDFNLVWIPISPYALAIFVAVTQSDLPLVVSPNCGVFVPFSSFLSVWFQISPEVLTSTPSFPSFLLRGVNFP